MSSSIYNQYTGYHNRRSIRLPGYNYSSIGYYFVTICIHDRTQKMFGNIVDGNMVLNAYGGIVRACWNDLPNHYANVVLDEFIIMPDHIHGIIIIRDIVGAGFKPAHGNADPAHGNATNDNGTNRAGLKPAPTDGNQSEKRHGLSEIIRAFKTFSSRRINKTGQSFQWQRNYYEHIIRTQKTLFSIRQYIRENAMNAELDSENH